MRNDDFETLQNRVEALEKRVEEQQKILTRLPSLVKILAEVIDSHKPAHRVDPKVAHYEIDRHVQGLITTEEIGPDEKKFFSHMGFPRRKKQP